MKVSALKPFETTRYGSVKQGQELPDCPDEQARQWIDIGLVESLEPPEPVTAEESGEGNYDTKVESNKPAKPSARTK